MHAAGASTGKRGGLAGALSDRVETCVSPVSTVQGGFISISSVPCYGPSALHMLDGAQAATEAARQAERRAASSSGHSAAFREEGSSQADISDKVHAHISRQQSLPAHAAAHGSHRPCTALGPWAASPLIASSHSGSETCWGHLGQIRHALHSDESAHKLYCRHARLQSLLRPPSTCCCSQPQRIQEPCTMQQSATCGPLFCWTCGNHLGAGSRRRQRSLLRARQPSTEAGCMPCAQMCKAQRRGPGPPAPRGCLAWAMP